MTPLALAWRTARRYRARAVLAVIGVAVIGALNFDMLMLSRGLVLSFADLLNGTNYNIRISGNSGLPLSRSPIIGSTGSCRLSDFRPISKPPAPTARTASLRNPISRNSTNCGVRSKEIWVLLSCHVSCVRALRCSILGAGLLMLSPPR